MTPLPPAVLADLIARWGGRPESLEFLVDGTNTLFRFRAGKTRAVLRVHHAGERNLIDVTAEAHWVYFLHRHGVRVSKPLLSENRLWVETAEWEGRELIAVAFRWVPGDEPTLTAGDGWKVKLVRRIGRQLGRMHALNRRYTPPEGIRRYHWADIDLPRGARLAAPAGESAYVENLERYWEWLQSLPRDPSIYGLVHGDFHAANLLVKRGRVTVIDFDGGSYNWFPFDIAHFLGMGLLAVDEADPAAAEDRLGGLFRELMRGYRWQYELDVEALDWMPEFLRGFCFLYYFNLLARFQDDPEKRREVPLYEVVRSVVLSDRLPIDLDFRRLYEEARRRPLGLWRLRFGSD